MDIVIATFDDWHGIYVDGKLEYENHSLQHRDVLEALKIEYTSIEVPMDELDMGHLPETVEELRKLMEESE